MKALKEIGWRKALKFAFLEASMLFYRVMILPPLRVWFLRLLGARIGSHVVLQNVRFFNLYRRGFGGLQIGDGCFIGEDCLIDLADEVRLADQVTLAERVVILTHINVGYKDHPLQKHFPASTAPVVIEEGCFVGASVMILHGVTVGAEAFVAAGSLVRESIPSRQLVAGVPARVIRPVDGKTTP